MSSAAAVATILMCLVFLGASLMKLTRQPASLEIRDRLGISPEQWTVIGVLELAGVAGALLGFALPALGIAATAGLLLAAGGALASHLRVRDAPPDAAAAVLAVVLSAAALALQITSI